MKSKFQKTLAIIISISILLSVISFGVILYNNNLSKLEKDVNTEATNIAVGINDTGFDYIEEILPYIGQGRITVIDADGKVLYDSEKDPEDMDNHLNREEVEEALLKGEGDSRRDSDTTLKETYYKAILLDNGQIVRVGEQIDNVILTTLEFIPWGLGIGVITFLVSLYIANVLTKNIITPLKEINLERPLENIPYKELKPLLIRIDENNKLKDENETMRREFSANVSHELKTPLTSISGYAEIMKSGIVPPEDMGEFSEKIYTESKRLILLIEDILKISKLDEGGFDLMKEEVDLYSMMRDITGRLSMQAKEKNLNIVIQGEPIMFYGVRHILDEMLYNLYENSIKYNRLNGSVRVWVGHRIGGAKVIIEDTGIGIPRGEEERIFERFYRIDKSHSKDTGGTGLGLSIVKHGANLHDISIKVNSELNKGTTIELEF